MNPGAYPIHEWMAREHGIPKHEWDQMVDRAMRRYLIESHPPQSPYRAPTLESLGPIERSELGGGAERVLAAAYGWTP